MREVRITEIQIKGTIIPNDDKSMYDWFDIESTCPNDVAKAFEQADGEDVDIYINSGGGDVDSANEIYSLIQRNSDRVKIHVAGRACSAATIIMCAAENDISATSMVMIHNVSTIAEGNHNDFEHAAQVLKTADRAICQAYVNKSGKPESEWLALMDKEKWFTAREAVEMGLCDKVVSPMMNGYCDVITPEQRKQFENAKAKAQAQIKLEKLKGDVKI